MLLMIDNYDSFTYNLVQYFGELGAEVKVVRNDELTVAAVVALAPERVVISPGPCTHMKRGSGATHRAACRSGADFGRLSRTSVNWSSVRRAYY